MLASQAAIDDGPAHIDPVLSSEVRSLKKDMKRLMKMMKSSHRDMQEVKKALNIKSKRRSHSSSSSSSGSSSSSRGSGESDGGGGGDSSYNRN
jgi:uncharacterized membrane protein YgcG